MRTALRRVDIVCEGKEDLVVAFVILEGYLGDVIVLFALHIYNVAVERSFVLSLCKELNERGYTALILHIVLAHRLASFVSYRYVYTRVEERLLTESREEGIVIEHRLVEYFGVGLESHVKAVSICFSLVLERADYRTALESFGVSSSLVGVVYLHPFREGVNDGCAHTVQTARKFISRASEFSSRVEYGIYHFEGGNAHFRVYTRGNTAAVVSDRDRIILVNYDFYSVTFSRHSLVYRVIHYFVNEMVKTSKTCRAYIHTRSFSYGLEAFKNLYLTFVIALLCIDVFDFFRHLICPSFFNRGALLGSYICLRQVVLLRSYICLRQVLLLRSYICLWQVVLLRSYLVILSFP